MDKQKFNRIAESLRQYRRADLGDFEAEIGPDPVDATYVDPLPDNAVLQIVLSSSTTFLLGRKGTGKSTIFARAQSEIRRQNKNIAVYVDVKSLNEVLSTEEAGVTATGDATLHPGVLQAHKIRKAFLGAVLADLLEEIDKSFDRLSLYDRWIGKRREYSDVRASLERLKTEVRSGKMTEAELPILRMISTNTKDRSQEKAGKERALAGGATLAPTKASISGRARSKTFEETLTDNEVYQTYSEAVLRSFPYADIITQIRDLLEEIGNASSCRIL